MRMRSAGLFLALSALAGGAIAATDARYYDIRPPVNGQQSAPNSTIQAKLDAFQHELGPKASIHINWDNIANQLNSITFSPAFPRPPGADATTRARAFLEANADLFGLSPQVIESMTPEIEVRESERDAIRFDQRFGGIPFFEQQGFIRVVSTPDGIKAVSGRYAVTAPAETTPRLNVSDAYAKLRQQLPNLWKTAEGKPSPHDGASGPVTFAPDTRLFARGSETLPARQRTLIQHVGMDFTNELTARLSYYLDGPQVRLTWEFNLQGTQDFFSDHGKPGLPIGIFEVLIDAENGSVVFAHVGSEPVPQGIAGAPPVQSQ